MTTLADIIKGHEVDGQSLTAMAITFDGELAGVALQLPGGKCVALCGSDLDKADDEFDYLALATARVIQEHVTGLQVAEELRKLKEAHPEGLTQRQLSEFLRGLEGGTA